MQRVLILTTDFGSGHRSAATALAATFARSQPSTLSFVVNPLHAPPIAQRFRAMERMYLQLVRFTPHWYDRLYRWTDTAQSTTILYAALLRAIRVGVQQVVTQYPADIVLSTFPLLTRAAQSLRDTSVPHITIITDVGVPHRLWWNAGDTMCVVPNFFARSALLGWGAAPHQIVVAGVPIHPDFIATGDVPQSNGGLYVRPSVLVLGGGAGIGGLAAIATALDAADLNIDLSLVTGSNAQLRARLAARAWQHPPRIYGLLPCLAPVMRQADLIISRAGGVTISEALALGKPLVLHGNSPGQEQRNRVFVTANGAGLAAATPAAVVAAVDHLLHNPNVYERVATAARQAATPTAAADIVRRTHDLLRGETMQH